MNDKRYILKEHPNGQYWKIIDTATEEEYSKMKAVELVNSLYENNSMTGEHYGLHNISDDCYQLTVDGELESGVLFDSEVTAKIIVRLLNQLMNEKEYYRKYALTFLHDYDIYSDDFLETLESIEGKDKVDGLRKNQNMILCSLRRENLL